MCDQYDTLWPQLIDLQVGRKLIFVAHSLGGKLTLTQFRPR
jgi:hypothetical protein